MQTSNNPTIIFPFECGDIEHIVTVQYTYQKGKKGSIIDGLQIEPNDDDTINIVSVNCESLEEVIAIDLCLDFYGYETMSELVMSEL